MYGDEYFLETTAMQPTGIAPIRKRANYTFHTIWIAVICIDDTSSFAELTFQ